METGKYIFHVFDSLTERHIRLALDSIWKQHPFQPLDFVLYNHSHFESSTVLDQAQRLLGDRFRSYSAFPHYPAEYTTLADIQHQLRFVDGADFYFLHKADFYLSQGLIRRALVCWRPEPFFVNCAKFDLREDVLEEAPWLSEMTWDEIVALPDALDLHRQTEPVDLAHRYSKIGYHGLDGVMHFYNESARQLIQMNHFCDEATVAANRQRGVDWVYGDTTFHTFHLFHVIPNLRSGNREIYGYRF